MKRVGIRLSRSLRKVGAAIGIDTLKNVVVYLFNFLYGAGGIWSRMLFPSQYTREDESIESMRHQFMLIFRPLHTTFVLTIIYLIANRLEAAQNILEKWPTLDTSEIIKIILKALIIIQIPVKFIVFLFEFVNNLLGDTFGVLTYFIPYNFSSAPSMILAYIGVYWLTQKFRYHTLISCGERLMQDFPGLATAINGIYVESPGTGKIKLSHKWEKIKEYIQLIVLCNFFLFLVLNVSTNFADKYVWKGSPFDLIPFTGFFCTLEVYRYLSLADVKPNQRKPNKSLDLAALRVGYQQYAEKWNISMTGVYWRSYDIKNAALHSAEEYYQDTDDSEIEFLYQYLAERNQLEHMDMAVRLIQGKNIFYASPFFKDVDACIFSVMFQTLIRKKRGLVLISGNENVEDIIEWMNEGLASLPGVEKLWSVAELREPIEDVDVGIMLFQNMRFELSTDERERFFQEVGFAIVLEASNILMGGQETIINLAENIHPQCTWLLCDWNAESMLDLFSHLLRADFTYVGATPVGAKETVIAYWDLESEPNRIWNPAKRFLGLEVGIAEVAGRNRLPRTVWYGEEWMPVVDMGWIIGQYYKLYSKKTLQPADQGKMNTQIQCSVSGISSSIEDENFLVVEDTCCNLYETGRQYATRGKEKIYVHVLSPNYLLRDFMKSQADTMQYDPKYIAQFVPEYVNSMRNIYIHLLRRLLTELVSEKEIDSLVQNCEEPPRLSYGDIDGMIRDIVHMLLNDTFFRTESEIEITVRRTYSERKDYMVHEKYYRIISKNIRNAFQKYFRQACYMDETGEKRRISRMMLAGHLQLKYLPGQYTTLDGKYYQVEQLLDSDEETLLVVKRASEQVVERRYYRQMREYTLEQTEGPNKCIFQENDVCLTRLAVRFKARTTGYIAIRGQWNNFSNALEQRFPSAQCFERQYDRKHALRVVIPKEKLTRTDFLYLAAVIHDMLYTFYPQYCHLLSVAVCWKEDEMAEKRRYRGVLSQLVNTPSSDESFDMWDSCFYIFEDSCEDMGLLRSIERHFRRILQIAADYIKWESDRSLDYFAG